MRRKDADDATLWEAYRVDQSVAARNAIFEHHYAWIQKALMFRLKASGRLGIYDKTLSILSERVLLSAIPNFSHDGGASFRTYLRRHIDGAIWDSDLESMRDRDQLPRLQRHRRHGILAIRTRLAHELGRRPTDAEVAEEAGISESAVIGAKKLPDVQADWSKLFPSSGKPDDHNGFDHLVSRLGQHNQKIMRSYYVDGKTMSEIADDEGVSESRISQRIRASVRFLRKSSVLADLGYDKIQ